MSESVYCFAYATLSNVVVNSLSITLSVSKEHKLSFRQIKFIISLSKVQY